MDNCTRTKSKGKYVWLMLNEEGYFIGLLGLNKGKKNYFNAEIWYKLFPEFWNKGFATEAVNVF
jgi:ribosomal-protein-alanine N-acetyltransferase